MGAFTKSVNKDTLPKDLLIKILTLTRVELKYLGLVNKMFNSLTKLSIVVANNYYNLYGIDSLAAYQARSKTVDNTVVSLLLETGAFTKFSSYGKPIDIDAVGDITDISLAATVGKMIVAMNDEIEEISEIITFLHTEAG